MGRAVLVVLWVAVSGACGDDDGPGGSPIDAEALEDPGCGARSSGCNPVWQTGCGVGEKCTPIRRDAVGDSVLGCVPAGDVATGGVCAYGPDGEATGSDDCIAGDVCVAGICERICVTAPDSCEGRSLCTGYDGLFCPTTTYGSCSAPCDPVDGATSCAVGSACYGNPGEPFRCNPIPEAATALVHGDAPYGPAAGAAYVNGCAFGYLPLLVATSGAPSPILCTATCRPEETYAGSTENLDGLVGSGFTCADRGATVAGTECHYFWSLQTNRRWEDNDVGFCWQPSSYVGDWDRDPSTPDAPWPSCTTLTTALVDSNGDTIPDVAEHRYYGCAQVLLGEDPDVQYARPPATPVSLPARWSL